MIVVPQFIVNHGAVLAVNHEDGLLELNTVGFIREDRKRIEAKLFEITKSLRVYGARITVCREMKRLPINQQRFFQLGKQNQPADGRFGGGHEQAVVATGVQAANGGGRKATAPDGVPALAVESGLQGATCFPF